MRTFAPVALLALLVAACGGSSTSTTPATPATTATVAAPSASGSAASVKNACPDGQIPAGPNHECLKTCVDASKCAKDQKCLPTSWEMAPGMMSHDSACF